MKKVWFRFYAELGDFIPPARRQVAFAHAFEGRVSVKHLIEALGVPHPEVDLILVNGESADFPMSSHPSAVNPRGPEMVDVFLLLACLNRPSVV